VPVDHGRTMASSAGRTRVVPAEGVHLSPGTILLVWEGYVVDGYVDLCDLEAGKVFHASNYVLTNRLRYPGDGLAVGHVQRKIHGDLPLADLDGDAPAAVHAARHVAKELPDGGGAVSRQPRAPVGEVDALYLLSRHIGESENHRVLYSGCPPIALKRVLLFSGCRHDDSPFVPFAEVP
jgi:hypothetical protein